MNEAQRIMLELVLTRKKQKLTQGEVCELAQVSTMSMVKLEQLNVKLSLDVVIRVAKALGREIKLT